MKDDPTLACDEGPALAGRGEGGGGAAPCVTVGVIFRNDLNPT